MNETGHLNETEIKSAGAHYTPAALADFLAQRALAQLNPELKRIRVLDPACGNGNLLRAIVRNAPAALRGRMELIGYETDSTALEEARNQLGALDVAKSTICDGDFLDAAESHYLRAQPLDLFAVPKPATETVDLIISNPPYVRTQVLGAARSRELAQRFNLSGRVDLYHAFVIGMWSVLSDRGVLALLTSNRFISIQSGAAMRKLLRSQFNLHEVYDLGDTKLFGAAVLPAIVIADKNSSARGTDRPFFSRIYESRKAKIDGRAKHYPSLLDALRDRHAGTISTSDGEYIVSQGKLSLNADATAPWLLESVESREWLGIVERHSNCRFGDVAEVRVGVKTTADNVFIRRTWQDLPQDARPEDELIFPLLTHHVARRWRAEEVYHASILYPHVIDPNGRKAAVDLSHFPRAGKYLQPHRTQLESRSYVIEAGRKWYEIWVPQQPDQWSQPKIVYPDISESPTFFFDDKGGIVNGDCYWITLRPGYDIDWLFLILAIANSRFIEEFYDKVFHNKLYAGRRRFMTQYVKQFPLLDLKNPTARKIAATSKVLATSELSVEQIHENEERLNSLIWLAYGVEPTI